MTRKDIDNLFELLAIFRPNDPHANDSKLRAAWFLVLEPYEKAAVREAVGAWFRKSGFWPDPSDIAKLCPPLPEKPVQEAKKIICPEYERLYKRWRELVEKRREDGLPGTVQEALQAGISEMDWRESLEKTGLDMAGIQWAGPRNCGTALAKTVC